MAVVRFFFFFIFFFFPYLRGICKSEKKIHYTECIISHAVVNTPVSESAKRFPPRPEGRRNLELSEAPQGRVSITHGPVTQTEMKKGRECALVGNNLHSSPSPPPPE
ncbi:MAG: ribosome-recycling factor [Circoviridae sp.]|nr:MAG: ribosome-recycling factor [Circoviridae sp.]